jgi:hypothetical protein
VLEQHEAVVVKRCAGASATPTAGTSDVSVSASIGSTSTMTVSVHSATSTGSRARPSSNGRAAFDVVTMRKSRRRSITSCSRMPATAIAPISIDSTATSDSTPGPRPASRW